ncbi:MAG: 50S ribosomal protein L24 [Opitutales bacterium]
MKFKIKRGDEVVVIAGADKGRRGEVLTIDRKKLRAKVRGVAIRTIHRKARKQDEESGIFEEEGTVHYSNLMLAERYDARRAAKGLATFEPVEEADEPADAEEEGADQREQ